MSLTRYIIVISTLAASIGMASAQTSDTLPPECRERKVADPEKCVVQDGPPPLPRVRKPQTPPVTPPPKPVPPEQVPGEMPGRIPKG